MKHKKGLGGRGKPSRSREQGFEQAPRKGTGQVGWGREVGTVQKPPLASGPSAQSWSLAVWSPGGLGRPTGIFTGIRSEDTETDHDFCPNKAKNRRPELRGVNTD